MGLKLFMYVLLCAAHTPSGVLGANDGSDLYRWRRQSLPRLQVTHTTVLDTPLFKGQDDNETLRTKIFCGIECQSNQPLMGQSEQEQILGYETVYHNGTRIHTDVRLQGFNQTSVKTLTTVVGHTRMKRQVYGADGRFVISGSHFVTNYPFSTAVRLSTGCSGVLISPKHVLTAARCLHDGRDYLESARKLRVGVLQVKAKQRRGSRRRGGRRRVKGAAETREEKKEELQIDEEKKSINRDVVGKRTRGEGRKRRRKKGQEGLRRGKETLSRIQRSAEPESEPVFRWARVKQIQIPQGWILAQSVNISISSDYDYAVLELKRPLKQKYMELGVAPSTTPLTRIHFSGYDADKSRSDGPRDQKVVYRFCSVAKESDDLMYQHCDAQDGATGAGVYVRLRQEAGRKGKWQRRVIGVFSGHRWVEEEGGEQKDYNVAVRITPAKFAQICHWILRDPSLCKEV